jgi:hypothetical protein
MFFARQGVEREGHGDRRVDVFHRFAIWFIVDEGTPESTATNQFGFLAVKRRLKSSRMF